MSCVMQKNALITHTNTLNSRFNFKHFANLLFILPLLLKYAWLVDMSTAFLGVLYA